MFKCDQKTGLLIMLAVPIRKSETESPYWSETGISYRSLQKGVSDQTNRGAVSATPPTRRWVSDAQIGNAGG
jgi:hypothetical protein